MEKSLFLQYFCVCSLSCIISMVYQKSLTVEFYWEQVNRETIGRIRQNCMHHLCVLIWKHIHNLGRTIWYRVSHLGGTIKNSCLGNCKAILFINMSNHLAICRHVQVRTLIKMNLIRACVMPNYNITHKR